MCIVMNMMRVGSVRRLAIAACVLLLVGISAGALQANEVKFRWAILAEKDGRLEPLDFSTTPVVHSGTPMQFYLEHLENCYIYLYLLDAGNQLMPLFPMKSGFYNYGFPRGQRYFPPGEQRFSFVPPGGIETFVIIATAERPIQLEKLTNELLDHPGSVEQQQLLQGIIEKMIGDREQRSKKKEDPERIERRIKTPDGPSTVEFEATEVDSGDFYGRRLPIDHR